MAVDYQMACQGGNGQMRLKGFDLIHNTIDVLSFSPWVGCTSPAACRRPCAAGQLVGRDLLVDRWVHVAIVGNPAKGETTMYGRVYPCFATARTRRASHRHGRGHHAVEGGAGSWSWRRADGCFGQIVEIRLAAEPLPSAP
jgi:hypothetical protein